MSLGKFQLSQSYKYYQFKLQKINEDNHLKNIASLNFKDIS